jgi:hypothetical protein
VLALLCAAGLARAQAPSTRPAARDVSRVVVRFNDGSEQSFASAAAPAPGQPSHARRRSLVGVNVGGINDHSRNRMFIDAMKSARRFGAPTKPWANKPGPVLDPKTGWPAEDFGVVVFTEQADVNGTYKLSFTGRATVDTVSSPARVEHLAYDPKTDRWSADVVVSARPGEGAQLFLSFTNTAGGVRDVKLIRPGYADDAAVFTKEILAALEPFGTLRFMDYLDTNDSTLVNWSDRTTPASARYSDGGAPYEHAIGLGNRTGKDVWLCVPHGATDDFVRELAKLVKRDLRPELNCYVEFSNEVWNGQFKQHKANREAAEAEVAAGDAGLSEDGKAPNKYYWAWRRVGKRTADISRIFGEEFGAGAINGRVRVILSGQHVNPKVLEEELEYIEQRVAPPKQVIWGIATAPYFGHDKALVARADLTIDDVCNVLLARVTAGNNKHVQNLLKLARKYEVRPIAYEGGVDLGQKAESLEAKVAAQFDPRAGQAVEQYLRNWFEAGGQEFLYYSHVSRYTKYGFWGLTDDLRRMDVPKFRAAATVAREYSDPPAGQ